MGKYMFNHGQADNAKGFEDATETIFNYIEKNIEFGDYVVHYIEDEVLNKPDKPTQVIKPSPIPDGISIIKQLLHEQERELYHD